MSRRLALLGLLSWSMVWMVRPAWPAESAELVFLAPPPNTPLFGVVEVEVTIPYGEGAVRRVELLLEGRPVGIRTDPPYRFSIDVGEDNLQRRIEAVAIGDDGPLGRAVLIAPAVELHDVVDLSLQQVYVTVDDGRGRRVLDLELDDFRLWDDGTEQEIVTFASGDIPFTAVLLLDASYSMRGERLPAAVRGARAFLAGMLKHDEASVMVFADRLLEVSPFAGPAATAPDALERAEAKGGTAVNDQLFFALRRLAERQGRRVLLLLSDGDDIHSVLRIEQVERAAQRSQAQIYWLRLDGGQQRSSHQFESWHAPEASRRALRRLALMVEASGGRILDLDDAAGIEQAFAEVLRELRQQYALGYYPSRDTGDGSWHPWKLEVPPRFEARAAAGYVDY